MRIELLELLIEGKTLHTDLITNYSNVLPKKIIDGGKESVNSNMLKNVNIILSLLNISEKRELFKPVNNLEEAIEVFRDNEIDAIIERAILNKDLAPHSLDRNQTLSVKDILEKTQFEIKSGIQQLQMHIVTGKMSKTYILDNL
jgi:hypothetical protein